LLPSSIFAFGPFLAIPHSNTKDLVSDGAGTNPDASHICKVHLTGDGIMGHGLATSFSRSTIAASGIEKITGEEFSTHNRWRLSFL